MKQETKTLDAICNNQENSRPTIKQRITAAFLAIALILELGVAGCVSYRKDTAQPTSKPTPAATRQLTDDDIITNISTDRAIAIARDEVRLKTEIDEAEYLLNYELRHPLGGQLRECWVNDVNEFRTRLDNLGGAGPETRRRLLERADKFYYEALKRQLPPELRVELIKEAKELSEELIKYSSTSRVRYDDAQLVEVLKKLLQTTAPTEISAAGYAAAADAIHLIDPVLADKWYRQAAHKDPELDPYTHIKLGSDVSTTVSNQYIRVKLTRDLSTILKNPKLSKNVSRMEIISLYNIFFSSRREMQSAITSDLDVEYWHDTAFKIQYDLAKDAEKNRDFQSAIYHYEKFLSLTEGVDYDREVYEGGYVLVTEKPFITTYATIHYKLANAYARLGHAHNAVSHFLEAARIFSNVCDN